ncbi:hypothetical protein Tco_1122385 [Tanacetum coccineum]|uniref:Uncharacterized protein n=1 Tax=Tanacetum coccineum TaxID=301880 RepID=A0ABQ5J0G4_9ASTR
MMTSKLPNPRGIQSMLNKWFLKKIKVQPRIIEAVLIVFPSVGYVVYLVYKAVGTMSLGRLNSASAMLLSTRFYVLAIIVSFTLAPCPLEVSSAQESHHLHDSNSLKAITTRLWVVNDGPPIPPPFSSLPEEVEQEPEVTKDTVLSSFPEEVEYK